MIRPQMIDPRLGGLIPAYMGITSDGTIGERAGATAGGLLGGVTGASLGSMPGEFIGSALKKPGLGKLLSLLGGAVGGTELGLGGLVVGKGLAQRLGAGEKALTPWASAKKNVSSALQHLKDVGGDLSGAASTGASAALQKLQEIGLHITQPVSDLLQSKTSEVIEHLEEKTSSAASTIKLLTDGGSRKSYVPWFVHQFLNSKIPQYLQSKGPLIGLGTGAIQGALGENKTVSERVRDAISGSVGGFVGSAPGLMLPKTKAPLPGILSLLGGLVGGRIGVKGVQEISREATKEDENPDTWGQTIGGTAGNLVGGIASLPASLATGVLAAAKFAPGNARKQQMIMQGTALLGTLLGSTVAGEAGRSYFKPKVE